MKRLQSEKYVFPLLLIILWGAAVCFAVPDGFVYGSSVDWLSQHVALAETIRTACLEQKTLLPQFLPLGGGSNGFQFSYYGFLRPDILIGCLFPQIPMVVILTFYMLLGYLACVLLCYRFLYLELMSRKAAFFGSVVFLLAACFFHVHRQVMFINYMPFLLAALLSIRKKKYALAAIFLALVYCNSFYYTIAVLAAVGWYWYRTEGRSFLWNYIKTAFFSCGMVAVLFCPTFLAILEHRRAGTGIGQIQIFQAKMNFLLYSPYGVGLTLICLYLLLCGLSVKKYRADSIFLLAVCSSGVSAWLLNGTLYARGKILIPFLPLIVLSAMRILVLLYRKEMKWQLWPFLPLLFCLYCNRNGSIKNWMLLDFLLLFLFALLSRYYRKRIIKTGTRCALYGILLAVPFFLQFRVSNQDTYVSLDKVKDLENSQTEVATGPLYRIDSLYDPLSTGNRIDPGTQAKSAMYSSVTNHDYSRFYYDLMQTPVQINNRIALLPEENPFLLQFMGIRYLETTADKIPGGYTVRESKNGRVIAENPFVLPMAYAVEEVMTEQEFWQLDSIGRLEALMQTTVIDEADAHADPAFQNPEPIQHRYGEKIRETEIAFSDMKKSGELSIAKLPDGGYDITAGKNASLTLNLEQAVKNKILLLDFEVENAGKDAVVIDINQIRNKLSGPGASYPNENHTFHYQFQAEDNRGLSSLTVQFSPGHYRTGEPDWYICSDKILTEKSYQEVKNLDTSGNEIFACSIEMQKDGYFVTSIPKQHGLKIYVDGEPVETLTVNTAFAGAKVSGGTHEIRVAFTAPGFPLGMAASLGILILFLITYCRDNKNCQESGFERIEEPCPEGLYFIK